MAGVDEGDESGRPSPSDAEPRPAGQPENAVTQLLPVVPTDPARRTEVPVVRAVARRAAAALPALGPATRRSGIPRSARATVDRTQPSTVDSQLADARTDPSAVRAEPAPEAPAATSTLDGALTADTPAFGTPALGVAYSDAPSSPGVPTDSDPDDSAPLTAYTAVDAVRTMDASTIEDAVIVDEPARPDVDQPDAAEEPGDSDPADVEETAPGDSLLADVEETAPGDSDPADAEVAAAPDDADPELPVPSPRVAADLEPDQPAEVAALDHGGAGSEPARDGWAESGWLSEGPADSARLRSTSRPDPTDGAGSDWLAEVPRRDSETGPIGDLASDAGTDAGPDWSADISRDSIAGSALDAGADAETDWSAEVALNGGAGSVVDLASDADAGSEWSADISRDSIAGSALDAGVDGESDWSAEVALNGGAGSVVDLASDADAGSEWSAAISRDSIAGSALDAGAVAETDWSAEVSRDGGAGSVVDLASDADAEADSLAEVPHRDSGTSPVTDLGPDTNAGSDWSAEGSHDDGAGSVTDAGADVESNWSADGADGPVVAAVAGADAGSDWSAGVARDGGAGSATDVVTGADVDDVASDGSAEVGSGGDDAADGAGDVPRPDGVGGGVRHDGVSGSRGWGRSESGPPDLVDLWGPAPDETPVDAVPVGGLSTSDSLARDDDTDRWPGDSDPGAGPDAGGAHGRDGRGSDGGRPGTDGGERALVLSTAAGSGRHAQPDPAGLPFAAGDTDEWILPAAAITADPLDSPSGALLRPGPIVLDADAWDEVPAADGITDDYHGRRRAGAAHPGRFWLVLVGALIVLGAAVSVPFALRSDPIPDQTNAQGPGGPATDPNDGARPTTQNGQLLPPTSGAPAPRTTARATGSPSPHGFGPNGSSSPPASGGPSPTGPTATTAPPGAPFGPLTLEAENMEGLVGWQRATVNACGSSGTLERTGRWYSQTAPGTVMFRNLTVPTSGAYTVTVSYAIDSTSGRTAQISVNNVAQPDQSFTGTNGCLRTRVLTMTLQSGGNTIVFANASGRGPTIDKIVISRT